MNYKLKLDMQTPVFDEKPKFSVMRTPRSLDLEITSRCNQRCKYCYYFENEAVEYVDLPTEEWLNFIDELGQSAVMNVTLQGGEPFMRKDIMALIERIVSNRMRFSILTNGTLVTQDLASFIAATGRCDLIQISLDGANAAVHDANRGKGSFEGALKGLHILQQFDLPIGVRVTITSHNVHQLDKTAKFLLEDLRLSSFGTNSAGYFGVCHQHASELMLSVKERTVAMETLARLSKQYNSRITATAGPLSEYHFWRRMEKARSERELPFPNGGYLTACGCHTNSLAVRADGAYIPCVMLAHVELGRINHDPLIKVWKDSSELNKLRTRQFIPLTDFSFCSDCSYIPYCTGNCPGLAYNLIGEINHPSPNACLKMFINDGGKIV